MFLAHSLAQAHIKADAYRSAWRSACSPWGISTEPLRPHDTSPLLLNSSKEFQSLSFFNKMLSLSDLKTEQRCSNRCFLHKVGGFVSLRRTGQFLNPRPPCPFEAGSWRDGSFSHAVTLRRGRTGLIDGPEVIGIHYHIQLAPRNCQITPR